MAKKTPLLSILILNYDTLEHLKACLDSIYGCPVDFAFEVLVLNNGSRRDTARQIKSLDERAIVFDLPFNVGFGQGNNLVASRAGGQYLLFLNSDTRFEDSSLSRFGEYVRAKPEVDVFGCEVFYPDGRPQTSFRNCRPGQPFRLVAETILQGHPISESIQRRLPKRREEAECPRYPFWISGCCLFMKREVFQKTGGFDPDFFLYFEETELFYNRIFPANFRIGYCEVIRIVHYEGASQASIAGEEQLALSRYLFYYKLGKGVFTWACLLTLLNLLSRVALMPLVPRCWSENLRRVRGDASRLLRAMAEVPIYSRAFGARPSPLIAPPYLSHFSWAKMTEHSLRRI